MNELCDVYRLIHIERSYKGGKRRPRELYGQQRKTTYLVQAVQEKGMDKRGLDDEWMKVSERTVYQASNRPLA